MNLGTSQPLNPRLKPLGEAASFFIRNRIGEWLPVAYQANTGGKALAI